MKICILARALPCHQPGGLEHHTLTLATHLAQRGHQVTLLTTQHANAQPCQKKFENIEVVHLPDTQPAQYDFTYFRNTRRYILANSQFDLVHSQGFAAWGYMFRKKIPLVTTIHGTTTSETNLFYDFSYRNLWQHRKRILSKPLETLLIKKSDAVLVDSLFSKDLLTSEYPIYHKKVNTVILGIDTEMFKPIDKSEAKKALNLPDSFTLLALGRLTQSKGFQIIIQALTELADLPVSLLISGDGDYRSALESDVQSRQLKNVTFLGKVDETKLPTLYSAADIFINPDLTAPAFGLVAAEAMACGTPVIASDTGALPEVVSSDTGFLFPRGDNHQLAVLIRLLCHDASLRIHMGKMARIRSISSFDSKEMTRNVELVYKKVLG